MAVRAVDIALVAGVATAIIAWWLAGGRSRPVSIAVIAVATGTATGHVLVAEPRWQVVAIHAAGAFVAIRAILDLARPRARRRHLLAIGALLVLAGGAVATWSLPVTELAAPDGTYPVGRQSFVLTDTSRTEQWGPTPGGDRTLAVTVWYPAADDADVPQAPWIDNADAVIAAITERLRLPDFTLSHLREVTTAAADHAPAAPNGPFPLVLFSHGWSGASFLHTNQLIDLASHGYVVAAIDHTYAALATVLDEEVALLDVASLPIEPGDDDHIAARGLLATFADDIDHTFGAITSRPLLDGTVDSTRVAVTGHSTGGGAAIMVCARVRWCDAVAGADPWVEPLPDDLLGRGLAVPLLSIRSAEWVDTPNDLRLRRLHAASTSDEGRVAIAGSQHQDFTLVPAVIRAGEPLGVHGHDSAETQEVTVTFLYRFFDHHLRGRGTNPLDDPPTNARISVARTTDSSPAAAGP